MSNPDHRQTGQTAFKLDDLCALARKKKASDLYLSAGNHPVIKGHGRVERLTEYPVLKQKNVDDLVYPILTSRQQQDLEGKLDLELMHRTKAAGNTRLVLYATQGGLAAACRLLPLKPPSFKRMGPEDSLKKIASFDRGLILIAGESNSGKTTTMAAIIDYMNTHFQKSIVTVEKTVEFTHKSKSSLIVQREIGVSAHDYAGSIRTAMRSDMDVLFLDDISSEPGAADLALDAAESHLVLATHRSFGGAGWLIRRIFEIFPADRQDFVQTQLARVLRATIWQHLLPFKDGRDSKIAMEIMVSTEKIAALIRSNELHKIHAEIEKGGESGMQTIGESVHKVTEGAVFVEDVIHIAKLAAPLVALI
jgi:twitching motility protein PilT